MGRETVGVLGVWGPVGSDDSRFVDCEFFDCFIRTAKGEDWKGTRCADDLDIPRLYYRSQAEIGL